MCPKLGHASLLNKFASVSSSQYFFRVSPYRDMLLLQNHDNIYNLVQWICDLHAIFYATD